MDSLQATGNRRFTALGERGAPHARYVNHDLAKYLIPVNADITDIETIMLP
uniref:hypothetical protein n=1 Tax=Gluconobacter thailandicus TaxID=257438 RepID=UPI0012E877C0|nr:hypothetical protein [Gluconobacter thailandicus]